MICKFEDGIFKGWDSAKKFNPKDFSSYDEYIDAVDQFQYEEAENIIIEIPDDVTILKKGCFWQCPFHFKGIKISKNIQEIEEGAFWYLNVDSISVDSNNPFFDSRDNCNCIINTKTNTLIYGNIYSIIPSSVQNIDYYAFCNGAFNDNDVKKYTRFDNAYYLGTKQNPYFMLVRAIDDSIVECNIHPSTNLIYISSFKNCNKLKGIIIPSSVFSICEDAFNGCSNLEKVEIQSDVKKISNNSFCYCSFLKNISIPSSIEEIEDRSLYGCSSIEEINYEGTMKDWRKLTENVVNVSVRNVVCKDGTINLFYH